jgi:hypothetical protein
MLNDKLILPIFYFGWKKQIRNVTKKKMEKKAEKNNELN